MVAKNLGYAWDWAGRQSVCVMLGGIFYAVAARAARERVALASSVWLPRAAGVV